MRLFIAVEPDADTIDAIRSLPRPECPGVRWTAEPTWHVTLRFLGELSDPEPALDALTNADLGPPVEATVGPATERLNRNVLVVPVEGLDELAGRVAEATAGLGQAPDARGFRGHLTVARRRRGGAALPAGAPVAHRFPVDEVVLFASTLTDRGAVHEVVRRFPLRPSSGRR